VDANERAQKRREESERLRKAARSTTPEAYQTRRVQRTDDVDRSVDLSQTHTSMFGEFSAGETWQSKIASATMLGSYGLAYVLLIIVLNLAQCSWWYEPGMYSDPDYVQSQGR